MSEETIITVSTRQLKLFQLENPLTSRLGGEFFRGLPAEPGVYFFYGDDNRLLYIGQSADLRARVGSYRHVTPEQNPKRTLRLVSKVVRIVWQVCATAAEAIELERVLLLEHRPPFNRAGVWQGEPWWLKALARDGFVHLELVRTESDHGPMPSAFRYVFGSLVRCLYRLAHPERALSDYPHGLTHAAVPLALSLALPASEDSLQLLRSYLAGESEAMMAQLAALPVPSSLGEQEYWQEDIERLERFATKLRALQVGILSGTIKDSPKLVKSEVSAQDAAWGLFDRIDSDEAGGA